MRCRCCPCLPRRSHRAQIRSGERSCFFSQQQQMATLLVHHLPPHLRSSLGVVVDVVLLLPDLMASRCSNHHLILRHPLQFDFFFD